MMFVLSFLFLVLASSSAEAGPTTHIVNGKVADAHAWPAQLSLQLDNSHICGAVLLNEDFVLTAAHCVDFPEYNVSRFSVVCGAHDILDKGVGQVSVAAEIKMHEDYNGNALGFPNDIAVIKVATPFKLDATCQPANLPPDSSKTYANKASHITGWGRLEGQSVVIHYDIQTTIGDNTGSGSPGVNLFIVNSAGEMVSNGNGQLPQKLKQAQINTISYSECRSRYGFIFNPIRDTHICVFDPSGVHGACNGDSGGPLFTPDRDTDLETVTGVTSFGRSGCNTAYPSVYTRVSSYVDWINLAKASM